MDRLEAMSVLLAAADGGSMSAASRRLGMPLATVSRKIADLERHLGSRLFSRSHRRLSLTEPGLAYVRASRRILEAVREAEHAAGGEFTAPKGELIVTAPIVFGRLHVLPIVTDFLKTYPDIDVRLILADHFLGFSDEHIDLAVRIGRLADSALLATNIGVMRRIFCASPDYLSVHGIPRHPADLAAHACVVFANTWPQGWSFAGLEPTPVRARLVVNTAEAAVDAAMAGIGVTRVFAYQAAAAVQAKSLVVILSDFEPSPSPISLVRVRQEPLPLKLRSFVDFAAPALRNGLSALMHL